MFLRGNFLGITPLFGAIDITPHITSYDTFKFYGGNVGAIFSKSWGRNIALTSEEINNYTLLTYNPSWTKETYFLQKFNNSLAAGNIEGLTTELLGWLLYRKENGYDNLEFLSELDTSNITYYDFNVLNDRAYTYYLFAKDSSKISSSILTNEISVDYFGWFLVDVQNNRAYHFDFNFDGGEKSYTDNITEFKTNNRVNSYTVGNRFFVDGKVSAIISKDNNRKDLQYTNEDLESLKEFILSERPKILKSRRSEVFNIFTFDYQENLLNKALSENIYVSSFSFREVGDI